MILYETVPVNGVGAETAVVTVLAGLGRPQRVRVRIVGELPELAQVSKLPWVCQFAGVGHFPRVCNFAGMRPFMWSAHHLSVHAGAHCRRCRHSHFHACRTNKKGAIRY